MQVCSRESSPVVARADVPHNFHYCTCKTYARASPALTSPQPTCIVSMWLNGSVELHLHSLWRTGLVIFYKGKTDTIGRVPRVGNCSTCKTGFPAPPATFQGAHRSAPWTSSLNCAGSKQKPYKITLTQCSQYRTRRSPTQKI
jgi:hypothetical protein